MIPAAIILLAVMAALIARVNMNQQRTYKELLVIKNLFFAYEHEKAHAQQSGTLTKYSTVAEELSEYEFNQMMKRWRKGKM